MGDMSDKYTSISLPGARTSGVGDWGHNSVEDMVRLIRKSADHMRAQVAAIDAAADSDFRVEQMIGPYARRNLKIIQEGRERK